MQILPLKPRPLYSMTMDKLILCFSGFKVKEHLVSLKKIKLHLDGSTEDESSARFKEHFWN